MSLCDGLNVLERWDEPGLLNVVREQGGAPSRCSEGTVGRKILAHTLNTLISSGRPRLLIPHTIKQSCCVVDTALRTSSILVGYRLLVTDIWLNMSSCWSTDLTNRKGSLWASSRMCVSCFSAVGVELLCFVLLRCVRSWAGVPVQLSFPWLRCRRGSTKWETPVHWSS